MAPPKVVLFDLGGVLLPFDRERRIAAIVARLGVTGPAARVFMADDIHRRLDTGEADERELARAFTILAGRPVGEGDACELILSVFEAPNAALWALAASLAQRVTVGGFSDNPGFVRRLFPAGAGLEPMLFSSEIGACKPSTEAFAIAEARLGVAPSEILFIDDSAANIDQARARGWDAALFVSNDQLTEDPRLRSLT